MRLPRAPALAFALAFALLSPAGAGAQDERDAAPVAAVSAPTASPVLADVAPPSADTAQVVFLKPANMGGDPVGIFDVDASGRRYLGGLPRQSRIAVELAPGRHRLMSYYGKHAHFLDADLEAGKRYFVVLRYIYGQGFQLRPIRPSAAHWTAEHPKFAIWLAETSVQEPRKNAERWFIERRPMVQRAQDEAQVLWERKSDGQRDELTLRPDDAL